MASDFYYLVKFYYNTRKKKNLCLTFHLFDDFYPDDKYGSFMKVCDRSIAYVGRLLGHKMCSFDRVEIYYGAWKFVSTFKDGDSILELI